MHKSEVNSAERMVTSLGAENGTRKATINTILILVRGSMLYKRIPISITTADVVFNQDVKALEPLQTISPRYTLYALQSMENYLLSLISRTGMGAGKLATDLLKSLEFPLPSLSEQQRIADALSAIDTKIEALTARLEATREFKRGLLQKMFV